MPNVNVFRGSDASLVLAVDNQESVEGKLAEALIGQYELSSVVGRLLSRIRKTLCYRITSG